MIPNNNAPGNEVFSDNDGIISSIEAQEYKDKFPGRWGSIKEVVLAHKILQRFQSMKQGRDTNCPFPNASNMISEEDFSVLSEKQRSGYSWEKLWDQEFDQYSMKRQYIVGRSNIKAATSFAPIEAAMSEFIKNRINPLFTATEPDDEAKITILEKLNSLLETKADMQKTRAGVFHDSLVYGTGVKHVTYQKRVRDVEIILADPDQAKQFIKDVMAKGDRKDKRKLQKRLKRGKPLTKKERIIEYDDIIEIHVPLYEIFVDENARCMRGPAYEATDLIWHQLPSLEQFKAEMKYNKDPYILQDNLSKVTTMYQAAQTLDKVTPFYRPASQTQPSSKVVDVKRYYNKQTDKYIILANDIVVRKGPLPYNHKELPFTFHVLFKLEHSIYGLGLPYFLEGVQATDEVTRNMFIELMWQQLRPSIIARKDIFNDIDEPMDRLEPGMKYDINGDPYKDIRWFEGPAPRQDFFQLSQFLENEATKASGINPLMSALPKQGEAVRNNMITVESSLSAIRRFIANWSEGELEAVRQRVQLMRQYYPVSFVKEVNKETGEKTFKSVRLEGMKLQPIYDDGSTESGEGKKMIRMNSDKVDTYSYFEVKDMYFDLTGDVDIKINMDSFPLVSEALQINNMTQALQIVPNLRANPALVNDPITQALLKAWIAAMKPDGSEDIMKLFDKDSSAEEVKRAMEQVQQMLDGVEIPGRPGESIAHKQLHMEVIFDLLGTKDELQSKSMNGDPEAMQQMQGVQKALSLLQKHLATDQIPQDQSVMAATQVGIQPPQPPMQPGMMPPGQPPMGGQPPMMDPSQMPPEQMGGGQPQMIGPAQGGAMPGTF